MKVLMVEPGKIPHEADIEPGLRSLQAAVDGLIQAVYPVSYTHLDVYKRQLFCHLNGKIQDR